ncbi:hypothetical protein DFH06DRAFT_1481877 [Mycena polygramma]|nr:hypothetical protein DFH06DRAFT_1481877 [Mycena polygramma]
MPATQLRVDPALLAYIESPQFCGVGLPELRPSNWEAVISSTAPIGCATSPYDLYVLEGKRIFDYVLFRAITNTMDLSKQPPGLLHHIETVVATDAVLGEVFKRTDTRTRTDGVWAIRDGFFAFIGAHWNQADRKTRATARWLLPVLEPIVIIIANSYLQPDTQTKSTRSRNKAPEEPHGVLFLRQLRRLPGLFTDPDSSLDTAESSDVSSLEVDRSPDSKSPDSPAEIASPTPLQVTVSSPAPIPSYAQWELSPLAPEVQNQLGTLIPLSPPSPALPGLAEYQRGSKLFWAPDLPGASGLDDELGTGPERGYAGASLLPGFELDLSQRMAALNFSSSKAMLEKDPWASPNNGPAFRTPSPPGPPVFWEDRLRLLDRVSPDPKEETVLEKVSVEVLIRESPVPQVVISTPASGDAVRRPLTPHNSPHTRNAGKEEKGKGREPMELCRATGSRLPLSCSVCPVWPAFELGIEFFSICL